MDGRRTKLRCLVGTEKDKSADLHGKHTDLYGKHVMCMEYHALSVFLLGGLVGSLLVWQVYRVVG